MRANHGPRDRRPAWVAQAVCPCGFHRRTQHGKARNRRQHAAHFGVESLPDRGQCLRRCGAGSQTRGKQVEGGWQLPPNRRAWRTRVRVTRPASQNDERRCRTDRAAEHQAADEPGQQTSDRSNHDRCPQPWPHPADAVLSQAAPPAVQSGATTRCPKRRGQQRRVRTRHLAPTRRGSSSDAHQSPSRERVRSAAGQPGRAQSHAGQP